MTEQAAVITGIHPGLSARGLDYGQNTIADWLCACGHHERATGRPRVEQLLARVRVGRCPHTNRSSS